MGANHRASLAALKRDKALARLIKKHPAPDFSSRASSSVFEALLRSIVYQQLSGYAARAIHGRVLALFPNPAKRGQTPLSGAKQKPTPKGLLKIPAKKLRAAGLSAQKVRYVRDLAHKCLDGTIDAKKLPKMSSEEIIEHLTAVNGVGEWTAHMVLIFTLGRPDILPTGDLGIRKGFQIAYNLKALPTKKEMEKLASRWNGHESIASWYFWRAADDPA